MHTEKSHVESVATELLHYEAQPLSKYELENVTRKSLGDFPWKCDCNPRDVICQLLAKEWFTWAPRQKKDGMTNCSLQGLSYHLLSTISISESYRSCCT